LSKTSTALRRVGVGVLSAATISSGLVGFAGGASAATTDINGLTIKPAAATISTGEDTCQLYTVTATENNAAIGGNVTVVLQPTGGVNSQFCSGTDIAANNYGTTPASHNVDVAAPNPNANGAQDSATFALNGSNQATFGVNEAAAAAGQIGITVFPQNSTSNTAASGAPTATALENIQTAAAQNDVVTSISASPASQIGTPGGTVHFTVTANSGSSAVVQGAKVYYSVKSSQGNSTGQDNVACAGTTDQNGTVDCAITVPATTSVQSGPYTVTFKVPQNTAAEIAANATHPSATIPASNPGPTTTATITTATAPKGNETVTVACGDKNTARTSASNCFVPLNATSISFTATVTTPTGTGGAAVAEPGVQVNWSVAGFVGNSAGNTTASSQSNLNPLSCVTDSTGSCSTTLSFKGTAAEGDEFQVTATLTNGRSGSATVTESNKTVPNTANNISVAAASPTATVGQQDIITATVTDAFGAPPNDQQQVTFTVTGAGTFSNGTTQQSVTADGTGHAQVTLVSSAAGTSNITASLNPTRSDCQDTAAQSGGAAGNCSATTSVTWSAATPPPPAKRTIFAKILFCKSPTKHALRCKIQETPAVAGLQVTLRSSSGKFLGSQRTNGKGLVVINHSPLKSGSKLRVHARVAGSATTKPATTQTVTVRIR